MSLSLGTSLLCRMNVCGRRWGLWEATRSGLPPKFPSGLDGGQGFKTEAAAWEEPYSLCAPHSWALLCGMRLTGSTGPGRPPRLHLPPPFYTHRNRDPKGLPHNRGLQGRWGLPHGAQSSTGRWLPT